MRSIVLGAIVAAGLSLVSAVPTVSAPANVAAIGQAAADIGTVSQPANTVPIVVKSLLFAGGMDRASVKSALIAAARSVSSSP